MAQQAKHYPAMVFTNVCHLMDRAFLLEASHQTPKSSAPGMDQVTAQQDAENLDENLRELHERLRAKRYVAPPVERGWIETEAGKKRPIGKPCFEDKMVQRAVVMILDAMFEPDLHAFSHGFRKGHSQPQALHELREQCRKQNLPWIVDAAVSGFFDTLDWSHLRAFMQQRVKDGGILRLIGKWRHAGVLEAGALSYPDKGTPPGGVVSPILANVCLHYVRDEWFVKGVQPRMQGRGFVTRFADAFLLGCELEADAHRVMDVWPTRFHRFGLTMHPEKTVLRAFQRPPNRAPSARGKGTCDLLGFTHSGATARRGYWVIKRKTVGKRLRRFMSGRWTWCRENRHAPLQEPYRALCAKLRGHSHYYGIRGHCKRLEAVCEYPERAWRYWLSRRSHKGHLNWQKFVDSIHRKLPLPKPRIMHHI